VKKCFLTESLDCPGGKTNHDTPVFTGDPYLPLLKNSRYIVANFVSKSAFWQRSYTIPSSILGKGVDNSRL
jgi:hypothetical protein